MTVLFAKAKSLVLVLAFVLAFVLMLPSILMPVHSYRTYMKEFPNAEQIPCPGGVDCYGSHVCAGFGHSNCANDDNNVLGEDFSNMGNIWSFQLCAADSDGDTRTNGDEMGDPCCVWNYGDTPEVTDVKKLGNPGFFSVKSPGPSCSDSPSTPTNMVASSIGSTKVELKWTTPVSSCTCTHVISITATTGSGYSQSVLHARNNQNPFVLCGLPANTQFTASVLPKNLFTGPAIAPAVITFTTSATKNNADNSLACSAVLSAPIKAGDGTRYQDGVWIHIHVPLSLFVFGIAVSAFVFSRRHERSPGIYSALVHREIWPGRLENLTCEQLLWICIIAGSSVAVSLYYTSTYDKQKYVWMPKALLARSIGAATFVPMAFLFVPITRHSLWARTLGVRLDRGVRFHRLLGAIVVILVLLHGALFVIGASKSPWGISMLFMEAPGEFLVLPATIAGVLFAIIGSFSFGFVRRRAYKLFKYVHFLFLPAVFLTVLHVNALIPYVIVPVSMWAVDYLYTLYRMHVAEPPRIVSFKRFQADPDDGCRMTMANIVFEQPGFEFTAGQFVYVYTNSSFDISHPFTIASAPQPEHPGRFEVIIRSMGPGTWTDRVVNELQWDENPGVAIYGPCGQPTLDMADFDHVMLFGGGVGITPCAALWDQKMQLPQNGREHVELHWSFKEEGLFENVLPILSRHMQQAGAAREDGGSGFKLNFYFTRRGGFRPVNQRDPERREGFRPVNQRDPERRGEDIESIELDPVQHYNGGIDDAADHIMHLAGTHGFMRDQVSVFRKRPSVLDVMTRFKRECIIAAERRGLQKRTILVAIAVCGPPAMLKDVRLQAHAISDSSVMFFVHTESFLF